MQSWPGIAGLALAAGLWAAPLSAQVPGAPPATPEPGPPAAIGTTVIEAPAASRNPDLVLPVMTLKNAPEEKEMTEANAGLRP